MENSIGIDIINKGNRRVKNDFTERRESDYFTKGKSVWECSREGCKTRYAVLIGKPALCLCGNTEFVKIETES